MRWTSDVWSRGSCRRRSSTPLARALPSRLSEQNPSTDAGNSVKTSIRTAGRHSPSSNSPAGRIDRDDAVGERHDERRRHEGAGLELEQVGGRVVDHRDAPTARRAVDLDHLGPDQLVDPQRVGVVDRLGGEHDAGQRFGRVAVLDALEVDPPAVVGAAGGGDGEPAVAGLQAAADGEPLHPIGGEVHEHVAAHAVRPADPADFEQAVGGHRRTASRGIRCRARRRPSTPPHG